MNRAVAAVGVLLVTASMTACGLGSDVLVGTAAPADDEPTAPTLEDSQEVVLDRRPLVYNVPQDWTVQSPSRISGYEEEDEDAPFGYSPVVSMSGVSTLPDPDDEDCLVAQAGSSAVEEPDMDTDMIAQGTAIAWAEAAYGKDGEDPEVDLGFTEPFEANGLEGDQVVANVTPVPGECNVTEAQVRVVSFDAPDADEVYNIIIYGTTVGLLAPTPDELDFIISSIRPAED